jgi:hypothetical protein
VTCRPKFALYYSSFPRKESQIRLTAKRENSMQGKEWGTRHLSKRKIGMGLILANKHSRRGRARACEPHGCVPKDGE